MSTVQHRDLMGEDLHPPGQHAVQHQTGGEDALSPAEIGAAAADHHHDDAYAALDHNHDAAYAALGHNHDAAYSGLGHNHDAAYAALGHDHVDLAKTDGSRAFSAPVAGKQFSNALHDNLNSPAIDWANGVWQRLTLNGNKTLTFANAATGHKLILVLAQDVTGSRTVTWPAGTKWEGAAAPTLSTAGEAIDIVAFISDGSSYYGQIYGQDFA